MNYLDNGIPFYAADAVLRGEYAERLVLLKPDSKIPDSAGYMDRLVTLAEIRWKFRRRALGLGLKLGKGLGVIDCDGPGMRELAGELLGIDTTEGMIARTDKGVHVYVRTNLDRRIIKWRGHHFDVLAKGFAVIPPSSVGGGMRREWETGMRQMAELPFLDAAKVLDPVPDRRTPTLIAATGDRYADAALRNEVRNVATAAEGTRNDSLNRAAFSLGGLVAVGVLSRDTVEAALVEAALAAGLGETEIAATLKSGMEAGIKRPRGGH